jgi:hypothetical protein
MTSRVMRGFRRLGLVLSLPLLLFGMFVAVQEFRAPSGPVSWVKTLPDSAIAMKNDEPFDNQHQKMKSEQEQQRIQLPAGYILVGRDLGPVNVQEYTSNRFADLVLKTNQGRAFELRDGRTIIVPATDEKMIIDLAWQLLWNEALRGKYFTGTTPMVFKDTPVIFRNGGNEKPSARWPMAAKADAPREFNWDMTKGFLAIAGLTFLLAWAIGWVIDGFFSSQSKTDNHRTK